MSRLQTQMNSVALNLFATRETQSTVGLYVFQFEMWRHGSAVTLVGSSPFLCACVFCVDLVCGCVGVCGWVLVWATLTIQFVPRSCAVIHQPASVFCALTINLFILSSVNLCLHCLVKNTQPALTCGTEYVFFLLSFLTTLNWHNKKFFEANQ